MKGVAIVPGPVTTQRHFFVFLLQVLPPLQEAPTGDQEVRPVEPASGARHSPEALLLQPLLEGQAGHGRRVPHQVRFTSEMQEHSQQLVIMRFSCSSGKFREISTARLGTFKSSLCEGLCVISPNDVLWPLWTFERHSGGHQIGLAFAGRV